MATQLRSSSCSISVECGYELSHLADLTTGNGRFLQQQCRDRNYRRPPLDYEWPKTMQPNAHCWKMWLSALKKCFLRPDDPHNQLRNSLGHWTHIPTTWDWFYLPMQDRLFERSNHQTWHPEHETKVINRHDSKDSAAPHTQSLTCPRMQFQLPPTAEARK
jgi:hypothetical protein